MYRKMNSPSSILLKKKININILEGFSSICDWWVWTGCSWINFEPIIARNPRHPCNNLIIPPMIVLQENMQMTLAARLSTAANLGHLDRRTQATNTLAGNIMLVQCQAIIFGFLVFLCSLAQNSLLVGEDQIYKNLSYEESILLCSTILITASLGNFLISLKVFLCVMIGRKCCCNPDNIAVPLAVGENQIILIVLGKLFKFKPCHDKKSNILILSHAIWSALSQTQTNDQSMQFTAFKTFMNIIVK